MGLLELIEEPSGKQISQIILLLLQPLQTGNEHFYIRVPALLMCLNVYPKMSTGHQSKVLDKLLSTVLIVVITVPI